VSFEVISDRPWAKVWRLSIPGAAYYLKACGPGFRREPALVSALAARFAALLPAVIAINPAEGFMLLADAGAPLRSLLMASPARGLALLQQAICTYADAQIALAADSTARATGLAAGLEDRSLAAYPALCAAVLQDPHVRADGGLDAEDLRQIPIVIEQCEVLSAELASYGLPMTLEHGDFHTGNIVAAGDTVRVIDWGDAAWTHPVFSGVACLDNVQRVLALAPAHPALTAISTAYIARWQAAGFDVDYASVLRLATRLRPVHGMLQWSRGLAQLDAIARRRAAAMCVDWMRQMQVD
jgi:Phosphotransferase enzyme family